LIFFQRLKEEETLKHELIGFSQRLMRGNTNTQMIDFFQRLREEKTEKHKLIAFF
jgi:hypothetical protein